MRRKEKNCVLLPAYNEQDAIGSVILEIRKFAKDLDIIVVDDGSSDDTYKIAKSLGVTVLRSRANKGVGEALKRGFRYALRKNYSFVVQIDSDGQHDPRDIKKLIKAYKDSSVDIIIGSRFLIYTAYKTPLSRLVCIKIFSILIALVFRKQVTDPTSGYRLFSPKAMKILIQKYTTDCPEAKSIPSIILSGLSFKEIPVHMRARQGGHSSLNWRSGGKCFLSSLWKIISSNRV